MLQFIVLGLLPGTNTQVPFELFINFGAITALIFLVHTLWKQGFDDNATDRDIIHRSVAQ